jgi:hypothetical protein
MLSPLSDSRELYIALNIRKLKDKCMFVQMHAAMNGVLTPTQRLPYEAGGKV